MLFFIRRRFMQVDRTYLPCTDSIRFDDCATVDRPNPDYLHQFEFVDECSDFTALKVRFFRDFAFDYDVLDDGVISVYDAFVYKGSLDDLNEETVRDNELLSDERDWQYFVQEYQLDFVEKSKVSIPSVWCSRFAKI